MVVRMHDGRIVSLLDYLPTERSFDRLCNDRKKNPSSQIRARQQDGVEVLVHINGFQVGSIRELNKLK